MVKSSVFGGIATALSNPQFRLYWFSNATSTIGRWVYRTAVGWLTWELTMDPIWLGIVAFADIFPMVVLSIFAGALSDRIGYIKVIKVAQFGMCVLGAAFAGAIYGGYLTIELIIALSVFHGSLEAMSTPARISIVHALVRKEDLSAAIALGSAMFNASRVVGPAIGGALLNWARPEFVMVIATLAFIQFYVVTFFIQAENAGGTGRISWELIEDMIQGVIYAWENVGIRFVMLMLMVVGLLIRPVMEFAPAFSAEVFGRGPEGYAMLLSSIGAGALVAALWLARRGRTGGLLRLVVASLVAQGIALVLFSFTSNIYVGAGFLVCMGFFMLIGGVGSQTLIQNAVHATMRARVVSLFILISWGLPAIGALMMGWSASHFGLQNSVTIGASLTIIIWLTVLRPSRRLAPALEAEGSE
jgi:predicted MFS family arabinose efflux permease